MELVAEAQAEAATASAVMDTETAAEAAPAEHQMGARAAEVEVEVMAAEAASDMAVVAMEEEAMGVEDLAEEESEVAELGKASPTQFVAGVFRTSGRASGCVCCCSFLILGEQF